jgi:hypothetical protein
LGLSVATAKSRAAEFDIDGQQTILRQLQFCLDCGSALLVTNVHPGTIVRCPDCGKEQPRLAAEHVATQVYQVCSLCRFPLDTHGFHPGAIVECGNCHTRQALSRDAFPDPSFLSGLGYAPGFPPGSRKKTRLYAPELAQAPVSVVPLESVQPDTSLPEPVPANFPTPRLNIPPPEFPMLEPAAPVFVPGDIPHTPEPEQPSGRAIDVPVVTADLFGGKRAENDAPTTAVQSPLSGEMVARVNGTPIFSSEIDRVAVPVMEKLRARATPEEKAELASRERELRKEILERLIDRELVMKEAARIGHRPDVTAVRRRTDELARLHNSVPGANIRREAERDIIMSDMRRRFAEKPVSVRPEDVREFYRANTDKLVQPRLLAIGQLAVFADREGHSDPRPYQEIAGEIASALERGVLFDDVRKQYDEFAPAVGQDLPEPILLPETAYASQLTAAAGSLRKGAVFGPIPMSGMILFGKVTDERPAGPIPFDHIEKEIRQRLESEATERHLEAWLKTLRERSVVELFID